jgi:glycosyltransferase involved in cell wall biosynthesis
MLAREDQLILWHGAPVFDPHDPEEIAGALQQPVTDSKLRRTVAQSGRQRALRFSKLGTARQTVKIPEEAAPSGTRPAHDRP